MLLNGKLRVQNGSLLLLQLGLDAVGYSPLTSMTTSTTIYSTFAIDLSYESSFTLFVFNLSSTI